MTRRVQDEKGLLEEATFERRDGGEIVLTGSINHDRGVIVEMDPDPVTIPATLDPGQVHFFDATTGEPLGIRLDDA